MVGTHDGGFSGSIVPVHKAPGGPYPRSSARYDRRSEETMGETVRALHVPYRSCISS